jgi:DNA-directed RNA polymerase specialized sigma24 family protein
MDILADTAALEPALLAFAGRLTDDEAEAGALVRLTLAEALAEPSEDGGPPTQARLFAIMRRAFHSIARRSTARRTRGSQGSGTWDSARAATFSQPQDPVE